MANTSSAKKSIRVQARKKVKNLRKLRAMREAKKALVNAATEKAGNVSELLNTYYKQVDKAAKHNGPLHKNTASRYKSRATKMVNGLVDAK